MAVVKPTRIGSNRLPIFEYYKYPLTNIFGSILAEPVISRIDKDRYRISYLYKGQPLESYNIMQINFFDENFSEFSEIYIGFLNELEILAKSRANDRALNDLLEYFRSQRFIDNARFYVLDLHGVQEVVISDWILEEPRSTRFSFIPYSNSLRKDRSTISVPFAHAGDRSQQIAYKENTISSKKGINRTGRGQRDIENRNDGKWLVLILLLLVIATFLWFLLNRPNSVTRSTSDGTRFAEQESPEKKPETPEGGTTSSPVDDYDGKKSLEPKMPQVVEHNTPDADSLRSEQGGTRKQIPSEPQLADGKNSKPSNTEVTTPPLQDHNEQKTDNAILSDNAKQDTLNTGASIPSYSKYGLSKQNQIPNTKDKADNSTNTESMKPQSSYNVPGHEPEILNSVNGTEPSPSETNAPKSTENSVGSEKPDNVVPTNKNATDQGANYHTSGDKAQKEQQPIVADSAEVAGPDQANTNSPTPTESSIVGQDNKDLDHPPVNDQIAPAIEVPKPSEEDQGNQKPSKSKSPDSIPADRESKLSRPVDQDNGTEVLGESNPITLSTPAPITADSCLDKQDGNSPQQNAEDKQINPAFNDPKHTENEQGDNKQEATKPTSGSLPINQIPGVPAKADSNQIKEIPVTASSIPIYIPQGLTLPLTYKWIPLGEFKKSDFIGSFNTAQPPALIKDIEYPVVVNFKYIISGANGKIAERTVKIEYLTKSSGE